MSVIEIDAERDPTLPRAIILDLSPVNFLDTVGVKTLRSVRTEQSHLLAHTQLEGKSTTCSDLNRKTPENRFKQYFWFVHPSVPFVHILPLRCLSLRNETVWITKSDLCSVLLLCLLQIRKDYGEIGIEVVLTSCQSMSNYYYITLSYDFIRVWQIRLFSLCKPHGLVVKNPFIFLPVQWSKNTIWKELHAIYGEQKCSKIISAFVFLHVTDSGAHNLRSFSNSRCYFSCSMIL